MSKLKRPTADLIPETPTETPSESTPTMHNAPTSKVEAVRRALEAGHTSPKDGSEWIAATWGIKVDPNYFSTVKQGAKGKKVVVKTASRPSAPSAPLRTTFDSDTLTIALARKVSELVREYGEEEVRKAVDFVAALR